MQAKIWSSGKLVHTGLLSQVARNENVPDNIAGKIYRDFLSHEPMGMYAEWNWELDGYPSLAEQHEKFTLV